MIATMLLAVSLVVGAMIDIANMRLPDWVTLPLLVAGLLFAFLREELAGLLFNGLGALLGFLLFWAVGRIYFQFRGVRGLGLGDAKLLAAAGAWLGPWYLAPIVFCSSIMGLVFVLFMYLRGWRPTASSAIAFGPFISLAFFGLWCAREYGGFELEF